MRFLSTLKCAATIFILLGAAAANANVVTLNFAGLQDTELVNNYYNGGTGSLGSGPGPSDGIVFSNGEVCVTVTGTCNNVANQPGPSTVLQFISGTAATMNVAAGFTTGFSFYYSAANTPGSVTVWSGLNGTGTELADLALPITLPAPAPGFSEDYSTWDPIGVSFAGTAESVDFGGSAEYIVFDDITLGASSPVGATPLPAALPLFATGLGLTGLLGWRRKRKASAAIAAA
jgi:hypothetical protein